MLAAGSHDVNNLDRRPILALVLCVGLISASQTSTEKRIGVRQDPHCLGCGGDLPSLWQAHGYPGRSLLGTRSSQSSSSGGDDGDSTELLKGGNTEEDGDNPECDDDENPWKMSTPEKIWLQAGWLPIFGLAVALPLLVAYLKMDPPADDHVQSSALDDCYSMINASWVSELVVGILAMLNFVLFASWTEAEAQTVDGTRDSLWISKAHSTVGIATMIVFTGITALRILACSRAVWNEWGLLSPVRYLFTDLFALVEVIGLAVSLAPRFNFLWVFLTRILMSFGSGSGVGVRKFHQMMTEDGKLLVTSFVIGLVLWLIMGGLYFNANRLNNTDDAVWASACWYDEKEGKYMKWMRFESIPSSMFFVLLSLVCEHPLADAHKTFEQRFVCCCLVIFCMPLFALPISVLQSTLFQESGTDQSIASGFVDDQGAPSKEKRTRFIWTAGLTLLSIITFFYYTAREERYGKVLGYTVSPHVCALVDGMVSLVFMVHFGRRYWQEYLHHRLRFSFMCVVDMIAWVPGLVHCILYFSLSGTQDIEWLRAVCVLRLLKLERYLHSFRDIWAIAHANAEVLMTTLGLSAALWMLFSCLLYATEKNNPDPEMNDEVYGSIWRAMWAEIINLHGEWPWADYTATGKGIAAFIALFSIMLFCVPISIFGEGLKQRMSVECRESFVTMPACTEPWEKRCKPDAPCAFQAAAYRVAYGHFSGDAAPTRAFHVFRAISVSFIAFTTVITLAGSVQKDPEHGDNSVVNLIWECGFWVELAAVAFFMVEYCFRVVASTGWHVCSFAGLCDALSIAGFVVTWTQQPARERMKPTDYWVLLRLLRLFSLEPYIQSMHELYTVMRLNHRALVRAGGATTTVWFIFATLLYLFERDPHQERQLEAPGAISNDAGDAEDPPMSLRYKDMLTALQFSIVHLFGDYPLAKYGLASKLAHVVSIIFGIAILSTFTGLFGASFVDYIQQGREKELEEFERKRMIAVWRAARTLQRAFRRRRAGHLIGRRKTGMEQRISSLRRSARNVTEQRTVFGRQMSFIFGAVLVMNLLATMAMSLPELDQARKGATVSSWTKDLLLYFEVLCTFVFSYEWSVHAWAHPKLMHRFWSIFNLLCLIPGLILCACELHSRVNMSESLESGLQGIILLRAIRILHWPCFRREVHMMCRAMHNAAPCLASPAYLALNIWIFGSALFMYLENSYEQLEKETNDKRLAGTAESMQSIPEAMYWCCIYLTGEWANVDFTFAASRLCIFFVAFGVAVFAMPVGIIVEAFQSTIQTVAREELDTQALMEMIESEAGAAGLQGCTIQHLDLQTSTISGQSPQLGDMELADVGAQQEKGMARQGV